MTKYKIHLTGKPSDLVQVSKGDEFAMMSDIFVLNNEQMEFKMLPPVVRSISPALNIVNDSTNSYIVLIERKPEERTIIYTHNRYDDEGDCTISKDLLLTIPIPWQHYFLQVSESVWHPMQLNSMGVYFSRSSIQSLDHQFYRPYLPNVFTHSGTGLQVYTDDDETGYTYVSNVCMGTPMPDEESIQFADLWEFCFQNFWSDRSFNQDATENMLYYFQNHPDTSKKIYDLIQYNDGSDYSDRDYSDLCCTLIKLLTKTPFKNVLDDKIFNSLMPAFSFDEYLGTLSKRKKQSNFNFIKLFKENIAGLEWSPLLKLSPNTKPKYKQFASTYPRMDTNGKWRDRHGRFTSPPVPRYTPYVLSGYTPIWSTGITTATTGTSTTSPLITSWAQMTPATNEETLS